MLLQATVANDVCERPLGQLAFSLQRSMHPPRPGIHEALMSERQGGCFETIMPMRDDLGDCQVLQFLQGKFRGKLPTLC